MKFSLFLFLISMAFGFVVQAQAAQTYSGVVVIAENPDFIKIKFRNEAPVLISKQKFDTAKDAAAFCEKNKTHLDRDSLELAMLLAMSGATKDNATIRNAVTFAINIPNLVNETGIWAWAADEDKVSVLYDGRGTNVDTLPLMEVKRIFVMGNQGEKARLAAICN